MKKEVFDFILSNFESIYEDISDTIMIYKKSIDNEYIVEKANNSFFKISGFKVKKVIKQEIRNIFNDELSLLMISLFKKSSGNNEKVVYETTIPIPSGSISWQIIVEIIRYNSEEYYFTKSTNISNKRELMETIKRLRTISQVAKIGGWEYNPLTGEVFWTEEMFNIFELDYSFNPTPNRIKRFFQPDELKPIKLKIDEAFKNGTSFDFISHFITANQRHLWVRIVVNAHFVDKKIKKLYGVLQDVTLIKQMELELEFEKSKLNEILETQQEIICRSLPDTTILYANQAYAKYFNESVEDLVKKKFIEFIPQEERASVFETIRKLQWNNRVIQYEHKVNKADGSTRWMEWTDCGIFDDFGNLIEVQSHGKDITERKQLELEILKSETLYKSLVQASPNGIILFDSKGKIGFINENVPNLLEIESDKILNSNINEWIYRKVTDVKALLNRIIKYPLTQNLEIKLLSDKNKIIDVEIFLSILKLPNEPINFLVLLHDITGKKQALQSKADIEKILNHTARLSTISALSAGISHEINQPLSAMKVMIDGMIYLKKNNYTTFQSTIEEKLTFASQQISRIESIIDHLRSMIYNKPETLFTHFDLHQSIQNVINILSTQIKNHNINLEFLPCVTQTTIMGYPIQLEQIIINLMNNAIYALDDDTKNEEKEIRISTKVMNNLVTIKVYNNGKCLSQDELDRIFEPFFSTKPQGLGTGLGLAICQQLIASFGGTITVRNIIPKGVEFILIIPESRG